MASSLSVNQVLKQINLPLLLSIGIHGLFFALIFPKLSSDNGFINRNLAKRESTPVIELNELEQTRIAESTPPPAINWNLIENLPESEDQNTAFNFPSAPNTNYIPSQRFSSNLNNLPSLPPLPPPPINSYNFSNNNFSPSNIPLPSPNNSPVEFSPPPNLPSVSNLDPQINQELLTNLPPIQEQSDLPIEDPQITSRRNLSPEEEAELRRRIFGNSLNEVTANPRDVINSRNPVNTTAPSLSAANPNTWQSPQKLRNIAQELQKDQANTSDEEANKNYVSWATEVKNAQPKKITLQGRYPKDACIRKLEGTTTYGVTVNNSGAVVQSKLIKSSGYGLFNNQALAQIKNHNFASSNGGNQPYHVFVNFKYDSKICPSLSVSNLGKVSPQKSPNSSSQTKPQTKPNPAPVKKENNNNPNNSQRSNPAQIETVVPVETSPRKQEPTINERLKLSPPNQKETSTTPATPSAPNSKTPTEQKQQTPKPTSTPPATKTPPVNKPEVSTPAPKTPTVKQPETKKPVQSAPAPKKTPAQQKPQTNSTPNLPNSPQNKADLLVKPTPAQQPQPKNIQPEVKVSPNPAPKKVQPDK